MSPITSTRAARGAAFALVTTLLLSLHGGQAMADEAAILTSLSWITPAPAAPRTEAPAPAAPRTGTAAPAPAPTGAARAVALAAAGGTPPQEQAKPSRAWRIGVGIATGLLVAGVATAAGVLSTLPERSR